MDCPVIEDIIHEEDRFALMIDGANLYQAARALGFDIDYRLLLETFSGCGRLVRACYYTALLDDQEYSPIRPLVDWLDYNGYTVVTKPLKEFTDASGRRKFKGNMDIELAVDAMEMASYLDHLVLFSGDGDFRRLTEALQRTGPAGHGGQHDPHPAADDRRRAAPAGRHLPRAERAVVVHRARASPRRGGRMTTRTRTRERSRARPRSGRFYQNA